MPRKHLLDLSGLTEAPPAAAAAAAEGKGEPPPAPPVALPSPPAARAALPVAIGEVRALQPQHLAGLPLATSLRLATACGRELWATAGREAYTALRAAGVPCITARELCVLAHGAENGRQSHEVLACWLERGGGLYADPHIDIAAYGGVYALQTPNHRWLLGQTLDAWGLTLVNVIVGNPPNCEVIV
jgi:hypothetical protein